MQIVIDIPAEDFEKVKCGRGAVSMMRKAIIHGTPLPDGAEILTKEAYSDLCTRAANSCTTTGSSTTDSDSSTDSTTVEPAKVISYWHKNENGCYICMNCNGGFFDQPTIDQPDGSVRPAFDYCPSCGAYMEGER